MRELWEILVPTSDKHNNLYDVCHHKDWDRKISYICGGLSLLDPISGRWFSETMFEETMIPVRIACTREELDRIIDFTMEHYKQEAIMAYKISNEVIIKHKE